MHTRASNSELVEPLPKPERSLNRILRRRNRRVPFDQRNNPPQNSRIVYPPIHDINYFSHFLVALENLYHMDDEPMWAADRVVAPTPGSAITILETANEFAIKDLFDRLLGEIRDFSHHENESLTDSWLRMKEMLRNCHGHHLSKGNIIKIFYHGLNEITQEVLNAAAGGSSNSDTDKIIARMDAMTIKMDAQYKELQNHAKKTKPNLDEDDIPMSREEEAKFMQTFSDLGASINLMPYSLYAKLSLETLKPTKMSVRLADKSFQYPVGIAKNMLVEVGKFTFPADFVIFEMEEDSKVPLILRRLFLHTADAVIRVKWKQLNLGVGTERMIFNIDSAMKHTYSNDVTCFSIDVIKEILEEDFDALLNEGNKILYSIERTLLEEEIFSEFDKFMAMTSDENYDSKSDTQEPPLKKITINTGYKIKTSLEEPPTDLELKPLPDNLEYVFLEEPSFLLVIISSQLSKENKGKLISILKKHKKPLLGKQLTFLKEIVKLLDTGIIYLIADSPWVSPIYCVPKKSGITVVTNENDELVPTRTIMGWRVCIDNHKLNEETAKDHYPFPFMDQITYAYRRMPFGLCNAPATFQRCMLAIFHDMIEESVKVFMDDFSVFGNSFDKCLNNLDKMLQCCIDAHLVLNWEKCHFMVKEGIVLGHKVSSARLEVDKAKIDIISKLPPLPILKVLEASSATSVFTNDSLKTFKKLPDLLLSCLKKILLLNLMMNVLL
ncbi:reverse transcriptase domain-containing protein [Tanacetum coccineum]